MEFLAMIAAWATMCFQTSSFIPLYMTLCASFSTHLESLAGTTAMDRIRCLVNGFGASTICVVIVGIDRIRVGGDLRLFAFDEDCT